VPTYEYACTACGHRFDAVQRFSDEALTECPECGGALRKVYGAVGIVLKGSGFYKTDSRVAAGSNGSNGKRSESSKGESSSAGADSGSGSDAGKSEKSEKSEKPQKSDKKDSKSSTPAASHAG
jgi:putative FmdB family regulatory protein